MEVTDINALRKDITESLKKIEEGYVTKAGLAKLEEQFKALESQNARAALRAQGDPIFSNKQNAADFVNCLRGAVAQSHLADRIDKSSPMYVNKADLNSYGTGTGVEVVPTATSELFSLLLSQGSVARANSTVIDGIQGSLILTKRNGTSTAAFTVATTLKDDAAVTAASLGTAKVTLTPQQISALSYVSEKLLYSSAVSIANIVAADMIEQAGVLEDNCVYKGDGTTAFGNITGLTADSAVPEQSVAAASYSLDDVLALPALVHESVQNSPTACYYMSGKALNTLRTKKASTSGVYHIDPTTGQPNLFGYPVKIWHRVDQTFVATKFPALFGDMKKAVTIGVGRGMTIDVSRDYRFANNQDAFRLTYDFDAKILQPSAMARLAITA